MSLDDAEGGAFLVVFAIGALLVYKLFGAGQQAAGAIASSYANIPAGGNNPPGQTIGNWWINMFASGFTNSQQPTNGPEVVMAVPRSAGSSADLTTGSVTTATTTGQAVTNAPAPDFSAAASWGIPMNNGGIGGAW